MEGLGIGALSPIMWVREDGKRVINTAGIGMGLAKGLLEVEPVPDEEGVVLINDERWRWVD